MSSVQVVTRENQTARKNSSLLLTWHVPESPAHQSFRRRRRRATPRLAEGRYRVLCPAMLCQARAGQLSVAEQMSGFCSKRFVRFLEPFQGLGDRNATRGKNVEVFGWDSSVSAWTVELRGGGGFAGDQRTAFSPVARSLRG